MKDFYIKMVDGKSYLFRGEKLQDIINAIGNALLYGNGFLEIRDALTYKYITININQIVSIEEDDEL